jgi:subtilisin family serine protease
MARNTTITRAAVLAAVLGLLGVACEPPDLSLTVNRFTDSRDLVPGDGICEATAGQGDCSLRAAVDEGNATAGTVGINLPAGTYTLTRAGVDDTNNGGDIDITGQISISGIGAVVDGGDLDRVFDVNGPAGLVGMTIRNGRTTGDGGGVRVRGGSLALALATVQSSEAGSRGGGVAVTAGTATITGTTISGNVAGLSGGGVHTAAATTASLVQSTLSGNAAGPDAGGGSGGGGQASGPGQELPPVAPPASPAPTSPVDAGGRQRVIVEVRTAPLPAGAGAAGLAGQAQAVASATEDLIAEIEALPDKDAQIQRTYSHVPAVALSATPEVVADLQADPDVVRVQADELTAPTLAQSVPQIGGDVVRAAGATGAGTSIAIIDSGVDSNEPMTNGKVVAQACYAAGAPGSGAVGNCPNGADSQTGGSSGAPCPWLNLGCWHGTHVASIAAGATRTIGGTPHTGVASGANLLSVNTGSRFTTEADCGTGITECMRIWSSDTLAALNWVITQVATHNVVAVNMSLGGGSNAAHCDGDVRKTAIDTLRAAGVATVIATGNSGDKGGIGSPACISSGISVGATLDNADTVAAYSQSAAILDVLAPGSNISAEYPTISGDPNDYTVTANGTSMAAPHVAGAVAVLKAANPSLTVSQIETLLSSTGVPVTDTNGITRPRIDLQEAYAFAASDGVGGAIDNAGTTTLVLSTITGNDAWFGGGIHNRGVVTSSGTVVGAQAGGGDCSLAPGATTTSGGYNLDSDDSCFSGPTDLTAAPQLGALANNGGLVATHLPGAGSPLRNVIPVGTATLCNGTYANDARFTARPQGAACDIGAVEA